MATIESSLPQVTLASRWTRLGALIIDTVLLWSPFLLLSILARTGSLSDSLSWGKVYFILIIWPLGIGLMQFILLTKDGQTAGKRALGIRIVSITTERNGGFITNVLLRQIVNGAISLIPVVGAFYVIIDGLFIFSSNKRCLHDLLAGTHVISGYPEEVQQSLAP